MPRFLLVKDLSPWRKLALVFWKKPQDPSVYGQFEFEASPALAYLEKINRKSKVKITLTHFVAKAIALTIAKHPNVNGIIKWGRIYRRTSVDIFLQVAVPDPERPDVEHLSGAKICDVDKKSLPEIADELRHTARDIRSNNDPQFQKTFHLARLLPSPILRYLVLFNEFLVYNLNLSFPSLGILPDPFGSAMLTSVGSLGVPPGFAPLVPPSRCPFLVCLGVVEMRPWADADHKVSVRPVVSFTATLDHRFMDGWIASKMFKTFMEILNNPDKFL